MRTANSIEAQKSVKTPKSSARRGTHPRSLANLRPPWKPGECPNPGGKPKHDVASAFARAVIEGSLDTAFAGFSKQLAKGNAYAFTQLAERGYGKLVQKQELTGKDGGPVQVSEISDADLNARIAQLERDLGLAGAIDEAGRIGSAQAGTARN